MRIALVQHHTTNSMEQNTENGLAALTAAAEKGAELVRMLHSLLGAEQFRVACDIYFDANDGKAATIEDFLVTMEKASGRDLGQFMRWYKVAGTPCLSVNEYEDW